MIRLARRWPFREKNNTVDWIRAWIAPARLI